MIEQRQELVTDEAREIIQDFLQRNFRAIRALRSACQVFENRPPYGDPARADTKERLEQIAKFVEEESGGLLHWPDDGSLCQIDDSYHLMQHTGTKFGGPLQKDTKAVRGFYFKFAHNGMDFNCFELDNGISRSYYDQKPAKEKSAFMTHFGEEVRKYDAAGNTRFPKGFIAFVSNNGDSYRIEAFAKVGNW